MEGERDRRRWERERIRLFPGHTRRVHRERHGLRWLPSHLAGVDRYGDAAHHRQPRLHSVGLDRRVHRGHRPRVGGVLPLVAAPPERGARCDVATPAPSASASVNLYTTSGRPRVAGSWSSGYDIALTQRRSPVRIRPSPLPYVAGPASTPPTGGSLRTT